MTKANQEPQIITVPLILTMAEIPAEIRELVEHLSLINSWGYKETLGVRMEAEAPADQRHLSLTFLGLANLPAALLFLGQVYPVLL